MKWIILSVIIVLLAIPVYFFILGITSKTGEFAGLQNGKLHQCSDKPNCVCSEYTVDKAHYIDPITFNIRKLNEITDSIVFVIEKMNGQIEIRNNNYIAATFESSFFGFIDDFEVRIEEASSSIHTRSASRVGHSDFGVNKARAEMFRVELQKHIDNQ